MPAQPALSTAPRLPFAVGERVGSATDPARRGTVLLAGLDRRSGRTEFYVTWTLGPPGGPHVYTAARLRRLTLQPDTTTTTEPGEPAGTARGGSVPITHTTAAAPPPSTWATFPWPDWVFPRIRRKITEFWSSKGKQPDDWLDDAREHQAPALGDKVTPHPEARRLPPGLYVHVQGRWGRVINPDAHPEPTVLGTYLREDGPHFFGWQPPGRS
ncbi:hypothetical protein L3Q67_01070 [Saccharothrix sp. AJ9571]|nr:hypothetical protein L3Q67_01070 [Saccharothrix sp. AJ9571]